MRSLVEFMRNNWFAPSRIALLVFLPALLLCSSPAECKFNFGFGRAAAKKGKAVFEKAREEEKKRHPKPAPELRPSALPYTALSAGALTANWESGGNPVGTVYTARLSVDNFFSITASSQTSVLHASFGGLSPNQTYYGQVRAGTGTYVSLGTAVTLANVPAAASSSFGNVSYSSFTAYWTANGNPSSITGYTAQLAVAPDFSGSLFSGSVYPSGGPAYTFTGLSQGTTYYLRVKSLNSAGAESAYVSLGSTVTAVQPGAPVPPVAATYSNVTASGLRANWTANGNPGGTSYTAQISTDGFSTLVNSSQTTNLYASFSGLGANRIYAGRVRAGSGSYVALGSTVTLANAPVGAAFSGVGTTALTANWTANGNPAGTQYLAQISADGFSSVLASSQTYGTSAAFSSLSQASTYAARVRAMNSGGTPTSYTSLGSTTTSSGAPPAPAITSALTASGVVSSAFSYQIAATNSPASYNATSLPAGLSVNTGTGLISGTPSGTGTTNVTISATNAGGTDTETLAITINNALPVAAAYSNATASALRANWASGGNPGGTVYTAQLSTDSFTTLVNSSQTANLYASFSGLGANRAYAGRVRAGAGSYVSLGSTVTLANAPVGAAFSGVGTTALTANWTANGNPAGTQYLAQLSADGFTSVLASSQTYGTSAAFSSLSQASTYAARVRAMNSGGTPTSYTSLGSTTTSSSGGSCVTSAGAWQNVSLASQNGTFTVEFDATPSMANMDAVIGVSTGPVANWGRVTATVRFNDAGRIDARSDTDYIAETIVPYSAGLPYHFRLLVNVTAHTFTAYSKQGAAAEQLIANNYDFRDGQQASTPLNNLTMYALSGSVQVCNVAITASAPPPAPVITSALTAGGNVGSAFNYQITATNGPTSYNATGLPAGLSVNTGTGLISGTPSGTGTSNMTISATNATGTGSATLVITINAAAAPVITSALTASGTVGSAFSYQITAANGPSSYNATGLPAGLSINTGTGLISGTPSGTGTSNVSISATNAGGTDTETLVLTIGASGSGDILWTDGIQAGAADWGFDYVMTECPIGNSVSPSDANGVNISRVADPLGGAGYALRFYTDFSRSDEGARAEVDLLSQANATFSAQAKSAAGIWVAQEWYFPQALSAGSDDYPWMNLWDWHSVGSDRWHTSPGIMPAKDGSMRVQFVWGGGSAAYNETSGFSSIALPVGRWFNIEMHYTWSTSTVTLSLWIDGALALEQTVARTRANAHTIVEMNTKSYGSTQGHTQWTPTPTIRYVRNIRFADGPITVP